eukprot:8130394-Pyramimonas_sp.AAC.1
MQLFQSYRARSPAPSAGVTQCPPFECPTTSELAQCSLEPSEVGRGRGRERIEGGTSTTKALVQTLKLLQAAERVLHANHIPAEPDIKVASVKVALLLALPVVGYSLSSSIHDVLRV